MKNIEKKFVDEKGERATMYIEKMDSGESNIKSNSKYKLANVNLKGNSNTKKKKNIFTSDIGVRSSGFAQIASLSFILAVAGIIIMVIMFRY